MHPHSVPAPDFSRRDSSKLRKHVSLVLLTFFMLRVRTHRHPMARQKTAKREYGCNSRPDISYHNQNDNSTPYTSSPRPVISG